MKIYCFYFDFNKSHLVELEAEEKPASYKLINAEDSGVYRSTIRKSELGISDEYGSRCFGLTKEQAIEGLIKHLNREIDQYKEKIRKLEEKTKNISDFLEEVRK